MWAQVLFVFEMKILLIFFKILRQNHNVTFVHQASSVPTYGCVQVSSPSPSPPNLKVLFYNGLLMRRLSRLWVFVDKATSYFDQKWNRSVKPLSISFPQVFIKRSEEALNISFVIKIKFWLVDFGFLKKQIILVSNQNAFQVCILWLACTYSEHLRQARLPTLVRIKCRMFLEYSYIYYWGGENGWMFMFSSQKAAFGVSSIICLLLMLWEPGKWKSESGSEFMKFDVIGAW